MRRLQFRSILPRGQRAFAAGAFLVLAVLLSARLLVRRPEGVAAAPPGAPPAVARFEDAYRAAFAAPPVLVRPVDYDGGSGAAWAPRREAPLLADLVARGALPPVHERVGPEPLVVRGTEGAANYGGTWRRASDRVGQAVFDASFRLAGATLVRWSPLGEPIVPGVAKSWSHSPDFRTWTFVLRRGMRWSDGHPFTTADVRYVVEDELPFDLVTPNPRWLVFRGKRGRVEVLDELRFAIHFEDPNPLLLQRVASASDHDGGFAAPAHYLRPFHPVHGDPAVIDAALRERQLSDRRLLYRTVRHLENPQHPRLWPWLYRTPRIGSPVTFVRNPYYWVVDEDGRQLPYLDQVVVEIKTPDLVPLAAASGALTFQEQFLPFSSYTLLAQEQARGGYEVRNWFSASRTFWALYPNLNRRVTSLEPESAAKAGLLNDRRFRQALSLALDRRALIATEVLGVGEPSQIAPGPFSAYHAPVLSESFIAHDPATANRLLDELGLTHRDTEGFRTFADGRRMTWYIDWTALTPSPPLLVREQFATVGLRFVDRLRSTSLFQTERMSGVQDFVGSISFPDFDPFMYPASYVPFTENCYFAREYGLWFHQGGLYGRPVAEMEMGAQAPPSDSPILAVMRIYDRALQEPDAAVRVGLFRELAAIAAREVWVINAASPPPVPTVVDRRLRNVPAVAVSAFFYATPANAGADTYCFAEPVSLPPRVLAELQREIRGPQASSASTGASLSWGRVAGWGLLVAAAAALAAIAGRHAYVRRRLALMVPALAIVSLLVFAVVQLPPGNYVDAQRLQLSVVGDAASRHELALLEELFHVADPWWKQYLRWTGLYWFTTFEPGDRGLLQGHLGITVETLPAMTVRPIAELIGDRLGLTVVISVGTILLTWAIAVPLGIFSATHRYTFGDYVLTAIGFIGMCVPNFLLAILLMYASGVWFGRPVTGLFSPEFAAQPHWDFRRVLDLLSNLWVPLLALGLGGTAAIIRVVRANLLDELRRPYVTTARAKGMRPVPLLLKYPVRLALNPVVSGLGSLFPYLISGEVIVATILSLPTIGPLLLAALFSQDMNLAGALLMLLAGLSMLGTLVSDLLLVWLDPRIRLEGKAA